MITAQPDGYLAVPPAGSGPGVLVQLVLVEVNDLDARLDDLEGERIARLDRFVEIDRAFVMAAVQLSPADEWIETRRIDSIGT